MKGKNRQSIGYKKEYRVFFQKETRQVFKTGRV